jgi:hypothetical protein
LAKRSHTSHSNRKFQHYAATTCVIKIIFDLISPSPEELTAKLIILVSESNPPVSIVYFSIICLLWDRTNDHYDTPFPEAKLFVETLTPSSLSILAVAIRGNFLILFIDKFHTIHADQWTVTISQSEEEIEKQI